MRIYLAGSLYVPELIQTIVDRGGNRLFSYYYHKESSGSHQEFVDYVNLINQQQNNELKDRVFLDSGAFSSMTQGVEINMEEYADFLKKWNINIYANLDVIGDAEGTLQNQKHMENLGVKPLPVFHLGEDWKYLKYYLEHYDYIALGGLAGSVSASQKYYTWMDEAFDMICDTPDRTPKAKIHGFGITTFKLLFRYPWWSVDSTSWNVTARYGGIFVPKIKNGKFIYNDVPWKVMVSNRSPAQGEEGKHFATFSKMEQDVISDYIHSNGFEMGYSEYKVVDEKYQCSEDERFVGPDEFIRLNYGTVPLVEKTVQLGLSNSYKARSIFNSIFFIEFAKYQTEWPWPFSSEKKTKLRKFGL